MSHPTRRVKAWEQQHLFAPDEVRVSIELTMSTESGRSDLCVAVYDVSASRSISTWCAPLVDASLLQEVIGEALVRFQIAADEYSPPF